MIKIIFIIFVLSIGILDYLLILGSAKLEREFQMANRCCGTCKYHQHEDIDDGWVCVNSDSEYCADWTGYLDKCDEWEARE